MLGYHISITRHSRLVVPDEEIITGKVEQPGKEQIQESFNSQEKSWLPPQPAGSDGFPDRLQEVSPLLSSPGRSSVWVQDLQVTGSRANPGGILQAAPTLLHIAAGGVVQVEPCCCLQPPLPLCPALPDHHPVGQHRQLLDQGSLFFSHGLHHLSFPCDLEEEERKESGPVAFHVGDGALSPL